MSSQPAENLSYLHERLDPPLRRKVHSTPNIKVVGFTQREHRLEALALRVQQLKLLGNRALFNGLLDEDQILTLANPGNARSLSKQRTDFYDYRRETVFAERFTPLTGVGTVVSLAGFAEGVALGQKWERLGLKVYVDETDRQKGLGSLMVRTILDNASAQNAEVIAVAPESAEIAESFYTGIGLAKTGQAVRSIKGTPINFNEFGGVSVDALKKSLDRRYVWLGSGIKDSNPIQPQSEKTA